MVRQGNERLTMTRQDYIDKEMIINGTQEELEKRRKTEQRAEVKTSETHQGGNHKIKEEVTKTTRNTKEGGFSKYDQNTREREEEKNTREIIIQLKLQNQFPTNNQKPKFIKGWIVTASVFTVSFQAH